MLAYERVAGLAPYTVAVAVAVIAYDTHITSMLIHQ
jgi:hypothetical protein